MKNRCVIVAGGDCDIKHLECISDSDYVIAADRGLEYINIANVTPQLVVGDFDSFSGQFPSDVEVIKLPTHKDDTDLLYALRCGVEKCFDRFLILGGYGSRPDQNLAMLQSLKWVTENCRVKEIKAMCCGFEVYAVSKSSLELEIDNNRYLSVFCIDSFAEGVSIEGAQYPLKNAILTSSFPIGVSNEGRGKITVSVKNGTLIVMVVDKNI